jgi:HEAT repeat protein
MEERVDELANERVRRLQRERDVDALIAELRNSAPFGQIGVRGWAARALGKLGDPRAVQPLLRLLREDDNEVVRSTAARSLGQIGDSSAVPALVAALDEESDVVRAWAADSLGRLGARSAARKVTSLLTSPNRVVRQAAAVSLGKIGDSSSIGPLSRAAKEDGWWHGRLYRRAIRGIRGS